MATYKGDWNTRESDEQGYAYNAFKRFFGREPSDVELAQATSAYQSGDRNKPNVQSGDAFVAQVYQQMNPNEANQKNAPGKYGEVDALFNQFVGRAATKEEKDHFGSLLASGQYDAYTIGQALQNLPESVRKEDETFRQSLSKEMETGDKRYFNEEILPSIQSQFAKQGRTVDATGFQNALAREAGAQNRQRESFLANLSAQQYQGNKANAYAEYLGNRDYTRGRSDLLADRNTQRLYDIQNFAAQKQAYDEYLKRYGKRSQGAGIGSLVGGIAGGALGAMSGTPFGVQAGFQMGSGLGGGIGSFF